MIDQEKIHDQCLSEDPEERKKALEQLRSNFSLLPDKQQAWNDLIRLTSDQEGSVKYGAISALGSEFSHVPDKQQAWNDLIKRTNDQDTLVGFGAAFALNSAFSHVPDKQQAWSDLHRLTTDEKRYVRCSVASVLVSAFPHVSDKQKVWDDLLRLSNDQSENDENIRAFANHSLGKISIFKASQAEKEEDYKKELEKAIVFFEKGARESPDKWSNPSQFCLPFYRSFHTIVFKKQEAKEEVDKYLEEAKDAIKGSKSKELLFQVVNNLANALKEVQNLGNLDFEAKKGELDFYRKYCDRAEELMINAEDAVPFATITMRKGLPILDRNLKEIQESTKIACKGLQGTPKAEVACTINRKIQKLEKSNPDEIAQNIEDIAYILKSQVADIPEYILNKIDLMINEKNPTEKTEILKYVIGNIIGQMSKENKISINIDGNANNVVFNSKDSNITVNPESKNPTKGGVIDSFATKAGFVGFIVLEVLNILHPLSRTDHIICLSSIAVLSVFVFVTYKK